MPIDAGEELTLVAAEKDGSTVRFVYTLKDENDPELAGYYQGMTNAEEAVEVCSTPNLAFFLQRGSRLEFVYLSSENDEIVRTIVRQKDCAMIESGGA
ncbi:MAG: hypothetical protein DHS20C11_06630 [Lysobacteraceae bacterium]|nr:MAG: hypothetical protein DHS20C11_06630 [Xanthomonadaceae bacterium]